MSETFDEFRKSILKVNDKRHHKIKGSLGVRDAFSWCRKNKLFGGEISTKEFYHIVRTVNNYLAAQLEAGSDVKFPQRMGQLEVRKFNPYVKFKDGKLRTNRGVNWRATLELWSNDEDARENKVLVRSEDKEAFIIFYNRMIANYNNKTLFQFKPNRELAIRIRKAGNEGIIDAYTIGK